VPADNCPPRETYLPAAVAAPRPACPERIGTGPVCPEGRRGGLGAAPAVAAGTGAVVVPVPVDTVIVGFLADTVVTFVRVGEARMIRVGPLTPPTIHVHAFNSHQGLVDTSLRQNSL
jgi:hypothetical protein